MGSWDAAAAPEMRWADGHIWALDLDLPGHADFEYKIVHMHCNGTSWESCQNRHASIYACAGCSDPQQHLLIDKLVNVPFQYANAAPFLCAGRWHRCVMSYK